jgi:hypothetical protein
VAAKHLHLASLALVRGREKTHQIPRPTSELVEILAIRGSGGPGRELKLWSGDDLIGNSVSP